jgi:alkylation response protein AidB-like acyl-CoA dehydrogenase
MAEEARMSYEVLSRIEKASDELRGRSQECERLGKLTAESAACLRESGVIRLLQPRRYGGYEGHPREFAETVMATARACPASGWVAGVVGVHPWELAMFDERVQQEIWGEDPDTWMASPYIPTGIAIPTDGGYRFTGRWSFSSGTDHCTWVMLGGLLGDESGAPATPFRSLHLLLPRSDYEIVEDSWDVVGLRGTGSKDLIIRDAFVPDYRVLDAAAVMEGTAAQAAGRDEALYRMPWSIQFPVGITSAVIGIAEGALDAHLDYQRQRVAATGQAIKDDPYALYAIGEASADIAAARAELLAMVDRIYDLVASGKQPTLEDRALGRRTQVRAAWRAVSAVDEIFARSGGGALRMSNPLQRYWRDAHAGLNHAIHTPGTTYHAAALTQMGIEPAGPLRMLL